MGNPFEWLRSVARSRSDDDHLALEAAAALSAVAHDPAQLVVACRRLVAHHPSNGALWWVASHLLAAADAGVAARTCHDVLAGDRTHDRLRDALPFCNDTERIATIGWSGAIAEALVERFDIDVVAIVDPDDRGAVRRASERASIIESWELLDRNAKLLLIPALAASPTRLLVTADVVDALAEAPTIEVWVVMSAGRLLAPRLFDAIATATLSDEMIAVIDYSRIGKIIGPRAVDTPADLVDRINCPVAAELLRPL